MKLRRMVEELKELVEKKPPIPRHYLKGCSKRSQQRNVRYFVHKKGFPVKQAVAASLSAMRKACSIDSKSRMSPSEMADKEG